MNLKTTRSEAIKQAWMVHRSSAARIAEFYARPICLCGCGERLAKANLEKQQRLYRPGHDSRLKALARRVIAGEVPAQKIPVVARLMHKRIGFLKSMPELAKAFQGRP
jgi:hypothetical protein